MQRTLLKIAAFVAITLAAANSPAADRNSPAAGRRPNVLFIMSDDHTTQAVGAYGSRLAKLNPTPVIDTLAKEGAMLTNCFVTNSICTPSRACILTGQYNHVNGVTDLGGRIEPARQYLAREMRGAGYHTAMIGKWHLKEEPGAFDFYKVLPGQGQYYDPVFRVQGDNAWPRNVVKHDGQHSSDAITDSTLHWLKDEWDRSRPFFVMHHFKAPHDMFTYANRYEDYLQDIEIPEPDSLYDNGNNGSIATRGHNDELIHVLGTSIGPRNHRRSYKSWGADGTTPDEIKHLAYQTYLKKYLRCVKGVDDNLGRLFAYLKQQGLYDDTVIIYTGDQGFMLGEHDYQDKRWMYDESMRMPLLVRYPKTIKPGTTSDAIVENIDFPALMLDFAGVRTPSQMQGRSFRSIVETGKEPADWKDAAYYRYWMHLAHHDNPAHFGIRTKTHKLIFFYGCGYKGENQTPPGWELYDLAKDPRELNNVYADPAYAKVAVELKAKLAAMRAANGDTDEDRPAIKKVVDEYWDYDAADRQRAIEISHSMLKRKKK
ncbi:MAG: sulfatase [Candidatus Nealsonbacteria bacterium]|nr:sulfatase [Candidatus Nealsonbacteria bacterium]